MNAIHHSIAALAAVTLLMAAPGCSTYSPQTQDVANEIRIDSDNDYSIGRPPERATLCVEANTQLTLRAQGLGNSARVQWLYEGQAIAGATERTYRFKVTKDNVGNYSYVTVPRAFRERGVPEYSAPVEVQAITSEKRRDKTVLLVWGKPAPPGGGGGTSCPGTYGAFITYKPKATFGWRQSGTEHAAMDGSAATVGCSKIEYFSEVGDTDCGPDSLQVPHVMDSRRYRFTIYFPVGCPYTTSHPIELTGFSLSRKRH